MKFVYMITQLRNLTEWDRVPFPSKQIWRRRGGECRHGRTISLCSVLRFPASKHQEKGLKNIFNGTFGHQEVWCINSSRVTSLIVIRHLDKFCSYFYIYNLREFQSNQPNLHLLYFSTHSGIKNSLSYPKHMLRAHYISISLAIVI